MMMTIEETREYMRKMEDSGQYRFYGEKIDDIPDDQVVDRYMDEIETDENTHVIVPDDTYIIKKANL